MAALFTRISIGLDSLFMASNSEQQEFGSEKSPNTVDISSFASFANFILAKFTIENKKPSTKYFCSNENFNRLDEKKVNEIFLSIL